MEGLLVRCLCRPFDQARHVIRFGDIHRVAGRDLDRFATGTLSHAALEIGIDVVVLLCCAPSAVLSEPNLLPGRFYISQTALYGADIQPSVERLTLRLCTAETIGRLTCSTAEVTARATQFCQATRRAKSMVLYGAQTSSAATLSRL